MEALTFENLYNTIIAKESSINEIIGVLNNPIFIWNMSLNKWCQLIKNFDETKKLDSLITNVAQAIYYKN